MHQQKAARSICIFHIPCRGTALAEKCSLLVSCGSSDRNSSPYNLLIGITVNTAGRLHLGHHTTGNLKFLQKLFIPLFLMNIKQHGTGGIGIIGNMYFPFGQFPDQPGINGTEQKLPPFRPFPGPFHMLQNPLNLRGGKIGIRNQPGLFFQSLCKPFPFQTVNHGSCSPALPYNGRIDGFSRLFLPHHCRFPLVGNSNSCNILGVHAQLPHSLGGHT